MVIDEEVGLGTELVQKSNITSYMDDDVQSNDGIIQNADEQCLYDFFEAVKLSELHKQETIVKNIDILQRCKFPNLYDRTGNFK